MTTRPHHRRWAMLCVAAAACPWLALAADPPLLANPAGAADSPATPWRTVGLPEQRMPFTQFSVATLDGQRVLRIDAKASYGNLVHPLPATQGEPAAHRLAWRWRVDEPNPAADLKRKTGDDNPVKVCALFDLPLSAVPFIERQLLRLARSRSAEPLPAATLCYVWDAQLPPGTVLDNVYSRRIRMVVLRGPEAGVKTWFSEQRDIHADFLRLFGDEAGGVVPPLRGIALAGDADNTQGRSVAHVGAVTLD